MDGVFTPAGAGGVRFCPVEPMGADDVASLFTSIERRLERLLARRGVPAGGEGFDMPDRYADEAPTLAGLAAASVRDVASMGRADLPDPPPIGRWHARQHGFDLHAGIVVPAGARDRLERLCRYALRPPVRAGPAAADA